MIPPAPDRDLFRCAFAHIAQLTGPYDSKTDQTDQTDQRLENAEEFGAPSRAELTSCPQELTSGDPKLTSRAARRSHFCPLRASNPSACTLHAAARQPPP
jgi:hypothetical protein